jgi:hypothetical protein
MRVRVNDITDITELKKKDKRRVRQNHMVDAL